MYQQLPSNPEPSTKELLKAFYNNFSIDGWQVANVAVTIGTTSTAIAFVQVPLNGLTANLFRHGACLPRSPGAGRLAAMRQLYTAFNTGLLGSGLRTTYVTTAKKTADSAPEELRSETKGNKSITPHQKTGMIAAFTLGDTLVSKIPESTAYLQKCNVIPKNFKMGTYNLRQTLVSGFMARYSGGIVNFGALCWLENTYAHYMPIEHNTTRHFVAGAASGMSAAIASYPFGYYADNLLYRATLGANGRLHIPGFLETVRCLSTYIKQTGLTNTLKQTGRTFSKQMPIRMARTGLTFSMVTGVSSALGPEPLTSVMGFFSPKPRKPSPDAGAEASKSMS